MIGNQRENNILFYEYIYAILDSSGVSIDFFKYLENNYRVILFGGSVRDYLVFKEKCKIRDFDFVMAGLASDSELLKLIENNFKTFKWNHNHFGGIKIVTDSIALDFWRLENTYAFRKGKVKTGIEYLLDTPMLNIDRYAYDMNKKQYVSKCNMYPLPREIDFNLYIDELLEINLVRAMVYSKRYNLKLSSPIMLKLKEVLSDEKRKKKMEEFQLYHYKEEKVNLDEFAEFINARRIL